MMKKEYQEPQYEVILLDGESIITESGKKPWETEETPMDDGDW